MHRSKLPLTVWFWAAHLMATHSNDMSALQFEAQLSITYKREASVFAATSGVDLGEALLNCREYAEAGNLLRWSVARYRALDTNDHRVIRAMSAATMAAYQAADYGSAEKQFEALIADLETEERNLSASAPG
jgi:hypothetical protein